MIRFITGAPGAGKTLWTLSFVRKLAEKEGRQVYYFNIPNITIPGWIELTREQATNPHELPQGSVVIVDEAWELWPQSKAGVKVPDWIELFATHRHRGHDFFILTQRPTSVHHFIRGLIGQHIHFERQFGLPRSRRYEWQKLGNPADKWSRKDATQSEFIFPKEVYGWYKSSDQHTVKVTLPWKRLALIGGLVVVVLGAGYSAYNRFTSLGASTKQTHQAVEQLAGQVTANQAQTTAQIARLEATLQGAEWSARFAPRVPGQPMSASFYDDQVKAASVPRISGCSRIQTPSRDSCRCTTQQGSVIVEITHRQCLFYVRNGWWDPLKADEAEHDPGTLQGLAGAGAAGADSGAAAPPPATPKIEPQKPAGSLQAAF